MLLDKKLKPIKKRHKKRIIPVHCPKRLRPAFVFYNAQVRATLKDSKQIGDKWKKMSVEDKRPYVELFKEDQRRYKAECEKMKTVGYLL